jgi:hypothetical protein
MQYLFLLIKGGCGTKGTLETVEHYDEIKGALLSWTMNIEDKCLLNGFK